MTVDEKLRVVIADLLRPEGIQVLQAEPRLVVEDHTESNAATLAAAVEEASALIVRSRTKVTAELIGSSSTLRIVGRAGVGVDNIDIPAATRRGIAVLNAPAANTYSTAELTFALLLAAARRIAEADSSVRAGEWRRSELRGAQLHGRTIGVVGVGRIGTEVVRRAQAFGMHVVAHDPFVTETRAGELGVELLALPDLLTKAEVLTLHIPRTPENTGLIGRKQIASMPEGAILVNAARGGLVCETALAEALESGHLKAAGLDVYDKEPLPEDSPLRNAPNLVLSPHLGASTLRAQQEVSRQIAISVRDGLLQSRYGSALNAPFADGDPERVGPVVDLGRRLGILLSELGDGQPGRIEVRYGGSVGAVLKPLVAGVAEGVLKKRVEPPINLVNALSIAEERGLDIQGARTKVVGDYTNYVELSANSSSGEELIVGGAVLSGRSQLRVIRIGDFWVDTDPSGTCLLVRTQDIPGVIGAIGTTLGKANANIAEYHLARRRAEGQSLEVIRIDGGALPTKVLDQLVAIEAVESVRQVDFG